MSSTLPSQADSRKAIAELRARAVVRQVESRRRSVAGRGLSSPDDPTPGLVCTTTSSSDGSCHLSSLASESLSASGASLGDCSSEGHDWRFVPGAAGDAGDCWSPAKVVCVACRFSFTKKCGSARRTKCEPCSGRHRLNVAAVGRSGWLDHGAHRGAFVTLTAPGADVIPWDRSRCSHGAEVRCGGGQGCVADADALALWHAGLPQRWSWFMTYLRRALPHVDVQFFKTYELQQRGALHLHVMMRFAGPVSQRSFKAAVRGCARHSVVRFGRQCKVDFVDLSDGDSVARLAGYCAKYASKTSDQVPSVRTISHVTGEVRTVSVRAWSASKSWGDTMRVLRARRFAWWLAQNAGGRPLAADPALDPKSDRYTDHDSGRSP